MYKGHEDGDSIKNNTTRIILTIIKTIRIKMDIL